MSDQPIDSVNYKRCVPKGLELCGVDKLFLQIHDASFPAFAEEDTRRGSPYSAGAARFLAQLRRLGFNGVQLGPQGATSVTNPSPYDGTIFSRSPLSLALGPLVEQGLLERRQLEMLLAERPDKRDRVSYAFACRVAERALRLIDANFVGGGASFAGVAERVREFRQRHAHWLDRDLAYTTLFERYGQASWRSWRDASGDPHPDQRLFAEAFEVETCERVAPVLALNPELVRRAVLGQWLVHEQHAELRRYCRSIGLKLYADLQIGVSDQDAWAYQALFLPNYRMGAPPSRTNPDGQPWGFPVLSPRAYLDADGEPGPAIRFVERRLRKIYAEYDGVRVDHPHGWVCPWVYRADLPDAFAAVRGGARLFASPNLPDHPELAQYSIVTPDQVNAAVPRYADDWVTRLSPDQIDRYQRVFTRLVSPDGASRQQLDLVCEVLSTLPFPLKCVLDRFGLGRFRVLQKVRPDNPLDVYRSENAEPVDWIMLGNHDTPTIWQLAEAWVRTGESKARAGDLSLRLAATPGDPEWIERYASDPGRLVHALFADLLISPARNIMVFFADVLGLTEQYNVPGTVNDANWSMRVPASYGRAYVRKLASDRALSLPLALGIALRSPRMSKMDAGLIHGIDAEAERLRAVGAAYAEAGRQG